MFEISKFKESDAEQWVELWASFEKGHKTRDQAIEVCKKNWPRILNDEKCYAFALREKESNLAVGFITFAVYWCAFTDQDECYISALSVLPQWRKNGGAKRLINKVIEFSRENNFKRVTWLTNSNHPDAIALYDKIADKEEWYRYKVNIT